MGTTSLSITPVLGNSSVVAINCGTSSPRLGGTINISAFPSLTGFTCRNNDITNISGYGANTVLEVFDCQDNAFAGTNIFETLSNKPNLRIFNWSAVRANQYPNLLGTFPDFSANTKLELLYLNNTALSGSNISFATLSSLRLLAVQFNRLSGPIPPLFTGTINNPNLVDVNLGNSASFRFTGSIHELSRFPNLLLYSVATNSLTGSIPSLSGATKLQRFFASDNQLTGPIPSLNGCTALNVFHCFTNQFTGSIPELYSNISLQDFRGQTNQFAGSIPSLSACTVLNTFQCENNQLDGFAGGSVSNTLDIFTANINQLPSSAVNDILAAFVAANRTTGTRILNLGGAGNSAPTGQGLVDKATLISRGWTVTTN